MIPSIDVFYANKAFNIINRGKTNLYLWGDRLGSGRRSIDSPPVTITPNEGAYHLDAEGIDKELLEKLGNNGEMRIPFELYVSGEDKKKRIINYELWVRTKDGVFKADTRNLGTEEKDFTRLK